MKYVLFSTLFALTLLASCRKDNAVVTAPPCAKVFVAVEDGESIAVIDPSTNQLIRNISLADTSGDMMMPHNVQSTPDGKSVWVTVNPMSPHSIDWLYVIDPVREEISGRVAIGSDVHLAHVVFDDASQHAYVTATDSDEVIEVNVASLTIERRFQLPAGHQPHGMRYSNGKLYVSNLAAGTNTIIDVATGTLTEIPSGGMAVQSAVTRDGRFFFSSIYDQKSILKYNILSGQSTWVTLPAFAQGPIQMYPSPNNDKLYICDQGVLLGRPASNQLFVMDIASETISDSVRVGAAPHGVVVSLDGRYIYLTNSDDNTVNVVDATTLDVVATIAVGVEPNGITYWSNHGGQP